MINASRRRTIGATLILLATIGGVYLSFEDTAPSSTEAPAGSRASDPLNTAYTIERSLVRLVGGKAEQEITPDSATKIRTQVFGEPVRGDLDQDGDADAALIIVQHPGGSAAFYYLAAAINFGNGFTGTKGLFLGDRVAPQNIEVKNGLIIANYANRKPEEPMTASPSVGTSKYAIIQNGNLIDISAADQKSRPFTGMLTIGHEVREFKLCDSGEALWILGDSPGLRAAQDAYNQAADEAKPYAPVFAILTGYSAAPPKDGFGADYKNALLTQNVVLVDADRKCL